MKNIKNYEELDTQIQDRYLLKLAPDFSVFDTAEKVLSSSDSNISHGIFGRWSESAPENTAEVTIQTPFRRGIFKVYTSGAVLAADKNKDIVYSLYTIGNDGFLYIVALDDQANIKLVFNNKAIELIGVAF